MSNLRTMSRDVHGGSSSRAENTPEGLAAQGEMREELIAIDPGLKHY